MEKTTSYIVESGESSGSDVTTIETVTVCTFDRRIDCMCKANEKESLNTLDSVVEAFLKLLREFSTE